MLVALALIGLSSARAGPPVGDPEAHAAAIAVVEGLRADPDRAWLETHVVPAGLPGGPGPAWYDRLERALGGALGEALDRDAPITAVDGPDYVRVVLGGPPFLSVTVRDGLIDAIEATSCGDCTEPTRFVSDLVSTATGTGDLSRRLLPGVDLRVAPWLEANPSLGTAWIAALEARNHTSRMLVWRLSAASIVGEEAGVVTVRYADGSTDPLPIVYVDGRWQLDYAGLAPDSPLRLDGEDAATWRDRDTVTAAATEGWTPGFQPSDDGTATRLGDRAIGALFDPRDGTVLVTVLDLDRVLSAVFRVDPDTQTVLARHAVPLSASAAPLPFGTWFERWHAAVTADGTRLAVSLPGQVREIDTDRGTSRVVLSTEATSVLAVDDGLLLAGSDTGRATVRGDGVRLDLRLDAAPIAMWVLGDAVLTVSALGTVTTQPLAGGPVTEIARACGGQAASAAPHPDGERVLVACGPDSGRLAAVVSLRSGEIEEVDGVGSVHGAASWSPDGRWYTAGAAGDELLLWEIGDPNPVARLGSRVRTVSWAPDASRVVTVDVHGHVWVWDVAAVRQARAL